MWIKRLVRISLAIAGLAVSWNLFFSSVYPIADRVRQDVRNELANHGGAYLPLKNIPSGFQAAILSTEDRRFYSHFGIDPKAIGRSLYVNLEQGPLQGGSTITQQLIRNTLLSQERTLERKTKEMLLAVALETQMSKREILELYLNVIYFGENAYGVDQAARVYFGRPLSELSYPEWTLLAGLPNAPSAYNPYVDFNLSKQRQKEVLQNLVETSSLSEQEAISYLNAPLSFVKQVRSTRQ